MHSPSNSHLFVSLYRLAERLVSAASNFLSTVLLGSLQAYKLLISPLLGSRCRFHPSCSVYAQEAIANCGPIKGGFLAIARLAKCGPWHPGGVDTPPECEHTHSISNNRNSA